MSKIVRRNLRSNIGEAKQGFVFTPVGLAVLILAIAPLPVHAQSRGAAKASQKPFVSYGLEKRIPLTTSKVIGYPEPPLPYRAKRAFPKLTFARPLYAIAEPMSDRILVTEQSGRIVAVKNDAEVAATEVFFQLANHDTYSLCFHPKFAENRQVFVFANGPNTEKSKKNRILRYEVTADAPRRIDPKTEKVIIEWTSNGHNGGEMQFGPDRMLYITAGDGTSDSDGDLTGQDISDLCSGVLRIDVDGAGPKEGYLVPKDNPFVGMKDARPELWAYGFRNPWRMTFHPKTGEMFVGDIGQDLWEYIELVERGGNYGWSVYEGTHPFNLERKRGPTPVSKPIIEHPHSEARSISGGYVYTGEKFKELQGLYIYGDYGTGKIWAARIENGKVSEHREIADTPYQILGFCIGQNGEIYVVDYAGPMYELERTPPDTPKYDFPKTLSRTGLFKSVKGHVVEPALIPYTVNSPLWSDRAYKERFIALPNESQIDFQENNAWKFPEGAVLVKSFALPDAKGNQRWIETRLMVIQQNEWVGYSYAWNDEQTEATLVESAGRDRTFTVADAAIESGTREQKWRFPSRAECMVCHSRAAGFVLGLNTLQMNKVHDYPRGQANQIRTLSKIGAIRATWVDHLVTLEARWERLKNPWRTAKSVLTPAPKVARWTNPYADLFNSLALDKPLWMVELERRWGEYRKQWVQKEQASPHHVTVLPKFAWEYNQLADPADTAVPVAARVKSYLQSNCAQCHVAAGGGNSAIDLSWNTALPSMQLLNRLPLHQKFGLSDARLVAPGKPEQSVLLERIARRGQGQMPPLATSIVDDQARQMLIEWIKSLPADNTPPKKSGEQ